LPKDVGLLDPTPGVLKNDGVAIDDLAYLIDRWLLLFPYNRKGNCFPRSVALYWCARRLGVPVRLHCGVRKDGRKLDGHAWLMLHGNPFQELSCHWKQFTVTFSYPFDPAPDKDGERPTHG